MWDPFRRAVLSRATARILIWASSFAVLIAAPARAQPVNPPAPEEKSLEDALEPDDAVEAAAGKERVQELGSTPTPAPVPAPPPPPPPLPPPAAVAPSLFQFTLKGTVAVTLFGQDVPFATGNGAAALLGPVRTPIDGWVIGGDVRQTRLSFNVRGPELFGAVPTANVEVEMFGGQQITTVPAPSATVTVRDAMGNVIGTGTTAGFTSSAQGDESLLPRLRTAYIELNWDAGTNLIRAGQYHNLLLAMVSASGAHPATLGYGAGQLGWRSPGITYQHRFRFGNDVNLDAALQVNRNSWTDNVPICPATATPPMTNCLPSGVSLGEAGLPQVQTRLLLSGGLKESPFPHYAPTLWQLHVVGHWDQKDLSGVASVAPAGMRDVMTTYAIEAGGKLRIGPVQLAANGWYGQNTGSLFGNLFQMQAPDKGDVTGFGVWGQLGLSLTKNFSLWGFAGIDRPNRNEAIAANFRSLQNIQLNGMIAYVDGPAVITLEWFNVSTLNYVAGAAATATTPAGPAQQLTFRGNQPSATFAYSF